MADDRKVCVVTGVNGYLGSALLRLLFKEQDRLGWKIIGTVRNPTNAKKIEALTDYFGDKLKDTTRFEFAHLDLNDAESIEKAFTGATYVIHSAGEMGLWEKRSED
jgi:nucleoside-diphosphate-sugar epimerase